MGKILMVNLPFSGHTNPTLPLAKELVSRGHNVTYVNAAEFRTKIEATGAKFIPYINYPENPSEKEKKKFSFRAAYDTVLNLEEKFDLLIYEMFFYPGFELAGKLDIPCVRQFSQPAWNENYFKSAPLVFRASAFIVDKMVMSGANKRYMGLAGKNLKKANLYDKPSLNLVYVPSVLQGCREQFDESYHFAIPPFSPAPSKQQIPYEKMNGKMIYISLGSIISDRSFYLNCIKAFANTNYSVVLNTGKIAPDSLGNIPGNIYAYSFVPQLEVLEHADLFLTHCGMNSVNEAISAKVPMVTMPVINDQITNSKRIVELGLGEHLRIGSSAKKIFEVCDRVLHNDEIAGLYQKVAEQMKGDHFAAAVDEIEKLIG